MLSARHGANGGTPPHYVGPFPFREPKVPPSAPYRADNMPLNGLSTTGWSGVGRAGSVKAPICRRSAHQKTNLRQKNIHRGPYSAIIMNLITDCFVVPKKPQRNTAIIA